MYLKLRILFTILAALCVAAALPVGALYGFVWAGIFAFSAFLFYGLMLICKQNQEETEKKTETFSESSSTEVEPDKTQNSNAKNDESHN